MPVREQLLLYRGAWYDVKCDSAYWVVLLNCVGLRSHTSRDGWSLGVL